MIRRVSRFQIFSILLLLVLGLTAPLPYVLVEPGTPSDTFGKVKGKSILEIVGRESYPTNGKLQLTSIWVTSPGSRLQTFELVRAWIDGERSVQPREVFYPRGIDPKKVTEENVVEMKTSQLSAQLAALENLQIPYQQKLIIKGFTDDSPNKAILKKEDQILSFAGSVVNSSTQLKALIARSEAKSVNVRVLRDGKELLLPIRVVSQVDLNSVDKSERKNLIGVMISEDYDLPFEVKINLKNIGGPSAGLIFALSIFDKLTKEDLVKGRNVAGTGTISPNGKVGPIGGIEEKLIGAAREGATLFLAPSLNCPEIRHIPRGLQVVPVDTLTEALAALRETDPERLPMCG